MSDTWYLTSCPHCSREVQIRRKGNDNVVQPHGEAPHSLYDRDNPCPGAGSKVPDASVTVVRL